MPPAPSRDLYRGEGRFFVDRGAVTTCVHDGSDLFEPAAFIPVHNARPPEGDRKTKPAGGTGLRAGRENDEWGREAWCRGENLRIDRLRHSFRVNLPNARIPELTGPDRLTDLPRLRPREPKRTDRMETVGPGEIPAMERLMEL